MTQVRNLSKVTIERVSPSEVTLWFDDNQGRVLELAMSDFEPDQDASDAALLSLAVELIRPSGGIAGFVAANASDHE